MKRRRRRRSQQPSQLRAFLGLAAFIAVAALLGLAGLPWWMLPLLAAAAGFLFAPHAGYTAALAFAAGFFVWWILAFNQHLDNGGVLADRVGQVFLGVKSAHLLWVTGLFGGMLAALGAVTGRFAADLWKKG